MVLDVLLVDVLVVVVVDVVVVVEVLVTVVLVVLVELVELAVVLVVLVELVVLAVVLVVLVEVVVVLVVLVELVTVDVVVVDDEVVVGDIPTPSVNICSLDQSSALGVAPWAACRCLILSKLQLGWVCSPMSSSSFFLL